MVSDIEKLTKQKIELLALEFADDRPRDRMNTGRRHWDEGWREQDGGDGFGGGAS